MLAYSWYALEKGTTGTKRTGMIKIKRSNVLLLLLLFVGHFATQGAVSISETHTNNTCYTGSNGDINITVSGGAAPYTYLWSDGIITEDRSGLTTGSYTVTVTDNLSATASAVITIASPAAIITSKNITHIDCGGGNTGAIDLTVTGGSGGYSYAWSDFVYTEDRANLTAANYYFTVTDANGCIKVDSANVTQPPGMVISKVITNVTCGSGANGAINISVTSGLPAYTYLWNDGITTEDRTAIAAGNYSLTITDQAGCTASATATVGQSGGGMAINTTSTNPSCNGGTNGTITVTSVIGSVGPYTFRWSDGPTTQNRTGLGAGSYTVTATSTTGCTASATVNLTQPAVLNVSLTPIMLTCFGSNNGAINTAVTGGTSPYSYNWGGGVFTQNRTGLATGTYTVTVTDFKGCTATQSTFVPQPLQLTLTATPSPQACIGGPTGSVTTNVMGGTGSYSYWWGSGITTPNRTNVNAGTYSVTVTDGNGCSASASSTVLGYTPMVLTNTKTNNVCYGGANGAINLSVSNGWTPYTFTWSNGATTEDISGLTAGSYTITVNDNHTCTATATIAISQPSFPININSTITDVTCNGGANGSISLSVSNGNAPYSYNWGGGITTQNRAALIAGVYPVTVTDNSSCSVSASYTVNEPNAIVISSTTNSPACNGANSGAINLAVTGGIAPYAYNWGGGITTQNRVNIAEGNYSVTVTDNTACTATHSVAVTQPAALLVVPTVTNVSCQGGNTGAISLAVSGGTTPYTFSWGGGITTQNRTGLAANTYSVTVTDNAGCAVNSISTVAQDASISVTANVSNVTCFGGNNGAITISVSGGTIPYTYNWGSGITTQNRTGLSLGNYTVVVTDANGCTGSQYTAVLQPSQLTINLQATSVACNGQNNGSIITTVSGGTGSYSYDWGGGVTTPNRLGLNAGNYSLTVTDANACTASSWVAISEPSSIVLGTSVVDVACYGASTGAVNLTVSGGTGAYGYAWSNGAITQNVTSIIAGQYRVTVTDANNCSQSVSATVAQGSQIVTSLSVINPGCYGQSNGSINLSVSGGAGSYNYNWSNTATSQGISSIAAGNYTVTITDAAGCTAGSNAVVTEPAQLNITTSKQNITCNGANNGSVNVTVMGGAGSYLYNWSNGATSEDISGLTAQTYTVTVTDNNLCTNTATIVITQPTVLTASSTQANVTCNGGSNGTITVNVTGGTTSYNYNWSDGANTLNRTSLQAGSYTLTVSDANGCTATTTNTLTQPTAIVLSSSKADVSCAGAATGNIDLTVSGGVPTYQYQWSNNSATQDLASITAGSYTVTVSDANLCTATHTTVVAQPSPITISFALNNVTCYGGNNGSIVTQTSGGNGGYVYNWSNGSQNASATGLSAGNYTLSINDATNCATSLTINVTQPNPIVLNHTSTLVSCSSPNSGAIDLSVSGGAFPYTYAWSNAATSQDVTNLSTGNYSVTVTDRDNCTATLGPVAITQPNGISLTTTVTNALCIGAANGAIDLTVTGGAGGYIYTWSHGATTQDVNGLTAGSYVVTVTDANSCIATTAVSVSQAQGVQVVLTKADATCYGATNGSVTTSISGNNGGVVYNWSNGATTQNITNLASGSYTVTVRDAQNCSSTSTAVVSQPQAIAINETHTNVDCNGNSTGAIQTAVSGGTGSYTYQWSNNVGSANVSGLTASTYRLTVTDAASCSATTAVTITQPAVLTLSETHKPYACASKPGAIDLEVVGGTGPYSYNWTSGSSSQDIANLTSGSYQVTVQDTRGCVATRAVIINQLPVLTTHILKTDVTCNGGNNGTINLTVAGGTAPYQYMWNNGATNSSLSNLPASSYRVLVTDSNSCVITDTTTITQPIEIRITETITNLLCHADANGAIQVSATGGNPGGYTYQWSNQSTAQLLQHLQAGTYTVTVADNQSCSATETYTLQQPAPISIVATVAPVACDGRSDGQILISATGGQQPYTYNWSNSAVTSAITALPTGSYSVTVTDGNNCTNIGSYIVGTAPAIVLTPAVRNNACAEVSTGAISLTVEGGSPGYSYDWSNGANVSAVSGIGQGTYAVTVTDARNCTITATYTVANGYSLTVDAMSSTTINLGESVQLSAVTNVDNGNVYSWTPAIGNINCNNCATTNATPTQETIYTIQVLDTNGCRASDTVTISVNSITDIFIPNAFSPNNDGNNDVFQLFGDVGTISFLDMKVFNRWGELVFESSKHNFEWDGTYKGEIVPQGTYIYVAKIAFVNGYVRNDLKGSLTVIR